MDGTLRQGPVVRDGYGPTGALVSDAVDQADVPARRVAIADVTRESFTVSERSTGSQFRFVFPGRRLDPAEQDGVWTSWHRWYDGRLTRAWPLVKSVRFGIAAATAKLLMPGATACPRADAERYFEVVLEPVHIDGEIEAVHD